VSRRPLNSGLATTTSSSNFNQIKQQKRERDALPLFNPLGLQTLEARSIAVFQPTRVDHDMIWGYLPEYGRCPRSSVCLPHRKTARTTRACREFLKRVQRAKRPFAVEIDGIEEISGSGVEQVVDLEEETSGPAFFVTCTRSHLVPEDDEAAIQKWQISSRASAIVDAAAISTGTSLRAARKDWLWDLYAAASKEDGDDGEVEDGDDDPSGKILALFSALARARDVPSTLLDVLAEAGLKWAMDMPAIRSLVESQRGSASYDADGACAICLRSEKEEPIERPCGHSFCRACVVQLSKRDLTNSCPTCRAPSPEPIGAQLMVQAVGREAHRVLRAALKPKRIKKNIVLAHTRVGAIRAAAAAAVLTEPPTQVSPVEVQVVSPPTYAFSVTAPPHLELSALLAIDKAEQAALAALATYQHLEQEPLAVHHIGDDEPEEEVQPCLNVGLVGHVAHGKSTVARMLTGKRTQQHSQEHRLHGATVKLGYANCRICRCSGACPAPECYVAASGDGSIAADTPNCRACDGPTHVVKTVSFVDCPGHHDLIQTMLTGASAFDAALLVVAANESIPAPQTALHLGILSEMSFTKDKVCVALNKSELLFGGGVEQGVSQLDAQVDKARWFLHGSAAEGSVVVPVSAQLGHGMDQIIEFLAELPARSDSTKLAARMSVLRSFDTNKPGANVVEPGSDEGSGAAEEPTETTRLGLTGGVLGGTLKQGTVSVGDRVELRPGRVVFDTKTSSGQASSKKKKQKNKAEAKILYVQPLRATVSRVMSGNIQLSRATPGGLIAVQLDLDPALARADGLTGQMVGAPGSLPPVWSTLCMDLQWMDKKQLSETTNPHSDSDSDSDSDSAAEERHPKAPAPKLQKSDCIRCHVGTASTTARVLRVSNSRGKVECKLDHAVCAQLGDKVAIEIRGEDGKSWSLRGFGVVRDGERCEIRELDGVTVVTDDPSAAEESGPLSLPLEGTAEESDDQRRATTLTTRRFASMLEKSNSSLLSRSRIKVPPPELVRDGGARAMWTNFGKTCKALTRPPSHVAAFFRAEGGLGEVSIAGDTAAATSVGVAGDDVSFVQLRIHTRARGLGVKVSRLLRQYCLKCVVCSQCQGAHTTLTRADDADIQRRSSTNMVLMCSDCGARRFAPRY